MDLARRSISAVYWNISTSAIKVFVLLIRSIVLARLLPIEIFGIYTFASSWVILTATLPNFGMGPAFLHRSSESLDEKHAADIHFTLKGIFVFVWMAVLILIAAGFTTGDTRYALIFLTLTYGGIELSQTPKLILTRRVIHRRLAIINLVIVLLSSIVALILAFWGFGLWALLSTDLVALVVTVSLLYIWRPIYRPRFAWNYQTVRYFFSFGAKSFYSTVLTQALDQVDDIWTGLFLGRTQLGFYSRAYTFATYPRRFLAMPVNAVVGGTYAELKGDRKRLSKAFFRTNSILVHSGFFIAGLLALVGREFVIIALGERWLPMLNAFRLMLVFTLFDPLNNTVSSLFNAMGEPEKIGRARSIQLIILVLGLISLGPLGGITGVAIAVDLMLVTGITILFAQARQHVDFSLYRLFGPPTIALVLGMIFARGILVIPWLPSSLWTTGGVKFFVFSSIYVLALFILEKKSILNFITKNSHLLPAFLQNKFLSQKSTTKPGYKNQINDR